MRISDWSSDVCSSDLDVDELRAMFRDKSEGLKGRLRIDMPSGAAKHLVVPHLAAFMRAPPQLQIDLGSADRRVDRTDERRVGKEVVSKGRSRRSPYHKKKKHQKEVRETAK